MQTRSLIYQRSEIFYKIAGQGNPVVLIHGFGEDSQIWDGLISALQNTYRIIVPDLPGSGLSMFVENASIETYATIIHEILKKENIDNVTMIGHSMGGYIAVAFAENYGAELNAFGLFHSSAFADDNVKKEARQKGIALIKSDGVLPFMKKSIQGLFTETFAGQNQSLIDTLVDNVKNVSAETAIQYYEAMMNRPDSTDLLEKFSRPVLFIIGTQDKAITLDVSLKQCYLPQISYVYILESSAHMGMLEETQTSTKAVLDFLSDTFADANHVK